MRGPNNYLKNLLIREGSTMAGKIARFSMGDPNQGHRRNDLDSMVLDFLLERMPEFVQLEVVRNEGWASAAGDKYFKKQRKTADNPGEHLRKYSFDMMQDIGNEMDDATGFMLFPSASDNCATVFDICMSPGGFSNAIRHRHNTAQIAGLSLPVSLGGHPLLLDGSKPKLRVKFADITMLSSDMSVSTIQPDHPGAANFSQDRPYVSKRFDLVICDGPVLRTKSRHSYRTELEACRLTMSQLVLALQRIKISGTLVNLLHRLDYWDSIQLLHTFSGFSNIQLFKSANRHAIRSSFYLVATNVQPKILAATAAIETWKRAWSSATFDFRSDEATVEDAAICLNAFGETLIRLGKPI